MATLPRPPVDLTPEQLFLGHLDHIEKAAEHAARRKRLSWQDSEEFSSEVKKRLVDGDYAIIQKFQGKCNFRTYLTTVVYHLVLDFQNSLWGKWRPSAEAVRLGPVAVQLDKLLNRDGMTLREAVEILVSNHRVEMSREKLEELAGKLPHRDPPRRKEGEEGLQNRDSGEPDPERRILGQERASRWQEVVRLFQEALRTLAAEDRLIVKMRGERKVVEIARILGLDQKALYRRLERLFATLRAELEKRGVTAEEVRELLGFSGGHFNA